MGKPAQISSSAIFATKGKAAAIAGTHARGVAASENLVDLNFKVPAEFRKRFKIAAAQQGVTGVDLLRQVFEAWEARQA